ncbi:hypothetical protein QT381_13735, partial [Galbitalea sp. SE-J8]|uniref:hypothetical protein n=1 Tax=Galbitalea sp. SE-J8 TaxID=3054952 RepID=UPI00259D2063
GGAGGGADGAGGPGGGAGGAGGPDGAGGGADGAGGPDGASSTTDAASPVAFGLPAAVNTVTWAAISPPRGGWTPVGSLEPGVLDRVARGGIEQIAAAVPDAVGGALVHRARAEVWGRPLRELESVPAGAAFAARALGFVHDGDTEAVPVYETGTWTRLSSPRGHVLVKRRSWSMSR